MTTCSVCAKEVEKLFRCTRCKSSTYAVCSQDCQRADWKRHKREECLVVKIVDGLPTDECTCNRCKADDWTDNHEGDKVSDFFNDLHMVRGEKGVYKIVNGEEIPLSKEELDMIAYPYPRFVHMGLGEIATSAGAETEPITFHAPNEKGFTVGQLAKALTKAEKGNVDKHNMPLMLGGGWYFEGFEHCKEPHAFIPKWGTSMVTRRNKMGFGIHGFGFNHINTRDFKC